MEAGRAVDLAESGRVRARAGRDCSPPPRGRDRGRRRAQRFHGGGLVPARGRGESGWVRVWQLFRRAVAAGRTAATWPGMARGQGAVREVVVGSLWNEARGFASGLADWQPRIGHPSDDLILTSHPGPPPSPVLCTGE